MSIIDRILGRPERQPRKVALINVKDYPRHLYKAYWAIWVSGDDDSGYEYHVEILAYEPIGWRYQGKEFVGRPDVPEPVYPKCQRDATKQEADAWRAECERIHKQNPQPVHLLDQTQGAELTRDEADTKAQQWVLDRIEQYRRIPR